MFLHWKEGRKEGGRGVTYVSSILLQALIDGGVVVYVVGFSMRELREMSGGEVASGVDGDVFELGEGQGRKGLDDGRWTIG